MIGAGIFALVGFAVSSNLSLEEIIATRNYSLAATVVAAILITEYFLKPSAG